MKSNLCLEFTDTDRMVKCEVSSGLIKSLSCLTRNSNTLAYSIEHVRDKLFREVRPLILDEEISDLKEVIQRRANGACLLYHRQEEAHREELLLLVYALCNLIGKVEVLSSSFAPFDKIFNIHGDPDEIPLHRPCAYRPEVLHTDGHADPRKSDHFIALVHWFEKNAAGGESTLLHLDEWEDLRHFLVDPLSSVPVEFVCGNDGSISQSRMCGEETLDRFRNRIFYSGPNGLCMRFAEEFIRQVEPGIRTYVKQIESSLIRSANVKRIKLKTGEALIINNMFWLHGREALKPHPGLVRELKRFRGRFFNDSQCREST